MHIAEIEVQFLLFVDGRRLFLGNSPSRIYVLPFVSKVLLEKRSNPFSLRQIVNDIFLLFLYSRGRQATAREPQSVPRSEFLLLAKR